MRSFAVSLRAEGDGEMKLIRRAIILAIAVILAIALYPTVRHSIERLYYPLEYADLINKASAAYGLDSSLIAAVIFEESKFDPAVRSKAGAVGLMQVMPQTGRWVAAKKGRRFEEKELLDPNVNVDFGSWYLKYLKDKYRDEDLALAAYNGGLDNVDRWIADGEAPATTVGKIPFKETREFVSRVKKTRAKYRELYEGELR